MSGLRFLKREEFGSVKIPGLYDLSFLDEILGPSAVMNFAFDSKTKFKKNTFSSTVNFAKTFHFNADSA
jgi:hypothetical protein